MPGQGQHLISFALPQATPRPSPPPPPLYHSIHTPQQLANQTNPTHNSHDAVDQANQHKYQKYKSQIESKSKEGGTQETPLRSYCLWNLHNTKLNLTTELPKRRQSQSRIERATKKKQIHTENVKNLICLLGLVTVLLLLPSLPALPSSNILHLVFASIYIVCWGLLICFVVVASSTDWLPACVKWYLAFEMRVRARREGKFCQGGVPKKKKNS